MKVLIACEESQIVTVEFRKLGFKAFSCDIEPCSGKYPEWHLQQNVISLLKEKWNMIIAFPPCTHLSCSGAKWFKEKIKDGRQQQGIDFFMNFINCKCERIAIENPVGIMSSLIQKFDKQIIQPWQFGDSFQKTTCLWLKGLPRLIPTKIVDKGEFFTTSTGKTMPLWYIKTPSNPKERSKYRSKTFLGIAKAMAKQWSKCLGKEIPARIKEFRL